LITGIEGRLAGSGPNWADVTIGGGVTMRASVPDPLALGAVGETVRLFTTLQVRDDSLTLYGFATQEARTAFETLITVNGVGPKVAISILSTMSTDTLTLAVSAGDPAAFKVVSGVGTKTANRIILELKGKLDWPEMASADPQVNGDRDLVDALTSLGYSVPEAMVAIAALPDGEPMTLEEKVRACLERMGRD
jgi:holliday junction DNA helicase RuvA